MDKENYFMCVYVYYSAFKKKEILLFAMAWVVLDGVMLSEISQRKTNTI